MELKYVIAHDVGTSSVKTVLIDSTGKVLGHSIEEYPLHTPRPGWVEQDPADYWDAIVKATRRVVENSQFVMNDLVGIIFTTQAMGIIPVDGDGNVLHPNISWVDGRAEKQAKQIMRKIGGSKIFKSLIGIEITGKDVVCKLLWIKQERPELYEKTDLFLDVNGYLKFRATGEKVTEWSGACSYSFDLKKKEWDSMIFKLIGVDKSKLPPLVRSVDSVGNGLTKSAADDLGLPEGTPVFGGCDDTQSALVGSTAVDEGEAHIYLGTSAWFGVASENAPKFKNGAVTLQSADPDKNIVVGITESAGIILEWVSKELYKGMKLDPNDDEVFHLMDQEIASVSPGSDYLIFTPWVLGERCPVSTTTTRGTIFNLGLEHKRAHIIRAIDEGVAYNLRWIIENFESDFGFKISNIKVVGGGSLSKEWMQILADVTKREIETVEQPKFAGSIGAAMTAFVGAGIFPEFRTVKDIVKVTGTFNPKEENFESKRNKVVFFLTIQTELPSSAYLP
ncbi:MAG: FGGY-family carbohydrate kinase [Candidatus Thorarchaeota archaeon]|nr:FGGY-family carbohydrate kinase [Candidatus Thorarchaeota archaeon]